MVAHRSTFVLCVTLVRHIMNQRTYPSYFLYRDNIGQFRWRYEASNGRIIAVSSESYVRKSDCMRSIDIMKASSASEVWMPTELLHAA